MAITFLFPDEIADILRHCAAGTVVEIYDGTRLAESIQKEGWVSFDDGILSSGNAWRYFANKYRSYCPFHETVNYIYDCLESGLGVEINGKNILEV